MNVTDSDTLARIAKFLKAETLTSKALKTIQLKKNLLVNFVAKPKHVDDDDEQRY